MTLIKTDRSRIERYEKCPRLRFYSTEYDGIGLEPSDERGLKLDARIGSGVHDGIEYAMLPDAAGTRTTDMRVRAALSAQVGADKFYRDIAADGINVDGLLDQQRAEVHEGAAIVTALVYGWTRVRLPTLLAEGDILAVEREMDVDFRVGDDVVRLMTRPDIVWHRKSDGSVFIRNLKTTREPRTVWREQWALDMQTLTEPLAVDQWLTGQTKEPFDKYDSTCEGVIIDGLVTGSVLDYPRGSGKFYHNTPLLYGWVKPGDAPFGEPEWCVAPDSLVLKTDLSWVRADSVMPGDELIGFDENVGTQKWPKLRPAVVTATTEVKKQSVRVITDRGEVVCSSDHLWPARGYAGKGQKWPWSKKIRWTMAEKLKPGETIPYLEHPWELADNWQGGYIAGVLDGEGAIASTVSFGQNEGVLMETMRDLLGAYGFSLREKDYPAGRKGSLGKKDFVNAAIKGGMVEGMKALGMFRPPRLLSKSHRLWNGRRITGKSRKVAKVLKVVPVEVMTLSGIETSTGTMIVNGLMSHNSARYEYTCDAPHKMLRGKCPGGRTHTMKGATKKSVAAEYPGGILAWIDHLLETDASLVQDQIIELPPIMRAPYAIERWKRQVLPREIDIHMDAQVYLRAIQENKPERFDAARFDAALDETFPMHTASGNCLRPGQCMCYPMCWGTAASDPLNAGFRHRKPHHPQETEDVTKHAQGEVSKPDNS